MSAAVVETYHGKHRAEDITNDVTVENLLRYKAYTANCKRTHYTGHLGADGKHERTP